MIIKENGLKYAKLIHVSIDNGKTDNSNKIYIMEEMSDGRIKCEYGRVGKQLTVEWKNGNRWDYVLKQKLSKAKNYIDVTELLTEYVIDEDSVLPKDNKIEKIKDSVVKKLIEELMAFANKSIQQNYKVTQESVSEKQILAAQEIISSVSGLISIGVNVKDVNDMLLKLFTIIPRKMDNVKNYLIEDIIDDKTLDNAQKVIDGEQSALDTMGGQVELIKQQREATLKAKKAIEEGKVVDESNDITILDQMGLSIEVENDIEALDLIKGLMGTNAKQIKKVYKVINNKTQDKFDKNLDNAKVKNKNYYFHGSRNENIFNLIQCGLLLRPNGVRTNGKMFGWGTYHADKAQKSIGYTSLRGSYWTNGAENKAYLILHDVHVGNQKHIYKHSSSCYDLNYVDLKKEGFDSVYAHGGGDLRNNEFIVYNENQTTISHLIEISN